MNKKLIFRAPDFLILLIIFHLIGNIVWIKLNNIPPAWDEAVNTKFSFGFYHFSQNIFYGHFDLKQMVSLFSDYYGPLIRILTSLMFFIFFPSIKLAQFTGTIFFLLSLLMIYFITKELYKSQWIALMATFIFSFYQAVYNYSRWLLLDIPLTFFILLTVFLLIKSEFFTNRKYTLLSFIGLGLSILTKFQAIIYLSIPFGYILFLSIKNKYKLLNNVILGSLTTFLLVFPWLIVSIDKLRFYFTFASSAKPFVDPSDLFDLTTWFHNLKLFIDYDISFFIFVFFVISLVFFLKHKNKYKNFILILIILTYIIFTIFPSKDLRFLFPILPFTAIIFAVGFREFYLRAQNITLFLLPSIIIFNFVMYLSLSFGFPFQKGIRKHIDLPYIKDIVYFNLSDYPVQIYDSRYWPVSEIVNAIDIESKQKPIDIVFLPNYNNFNGNTFSMYAEYKDKTYINIIGAEGRQRFSDAGEVKEYLKNKDYFIYTPNEVGVFYQIDKQAFEQIQKTITRNLYLNRVLILEKWQLPTGQDIYLVKKIVQFD